MKKWIMGITAALMLLGCETTGDPRQGGLFSWNEQKAAERQEELKTAQEESDRKVLDSRAESEQLEREKAAMQSEADRQKTLVTELDADLDSIRNQIKSLEARKTSTDKNVALAKKELDRLQRELNAVKSNASISVQQRQQRIDALKKDIETLMSGFIAEKPGK